MRIQNASIKAVLVYMLSHNTTDTMGVTVQEIATGIDLHQNTVYKVIRYWYAHPEILPGFRECSIRRVGYTRYIKQFYFVKEFTHNEAVALMSIRKWDSQKYQVDNGVIPHLWPDENDSLLPEALRTEPNQKDSDKS